MDNLIGAVLGSLAATVVASILIFVCVGLWIGIARMVGL